MTQDPSTTQTIDTLQALSRGIRQWIGRLRPKDGSAGRFTWALGLAERTTWSSRWRIPRERMAPPELSAKIAARLSTVDAASLAMAIGQRPGDLRDQDVVSLLKELLPSGDPHAHDLSSLSAARIVEMAGVPLAPEERRQCPACQSNVPPDATRCQWCGALLPDADPSQ